MACRPSSASSKPRPAGMTAAEARRLAARDQKRLGDQDVTPVNTQHTTGVNKSVKDR